MMISSKTYSLRRSYCTHAQTHFQLTPALVHSSSELFARRRLLLEGLGPREYVEGTGGAKVGGCASALLQQTTGYPGTENTETALVGFHSHTSECSGAAPL